MPYQNTETRLKALRDSGRKVSVGKQYDIEVDTGTRKDAGTDANVSIWIQGSNGRSPTYPLDNNADNFEKGNTDFFSVSCIDLGDLEKIWIGHDNSGDDEGWFLEEVRIYDEEQQKSWTFPCHRWLADDEQDQKIARILYAQSTP